VPPSAPPALTSAQREALGALLGAAAIGAAADTSEAAVRARAAGLGEAALREALLLLVPYAGYPRALTAFGRVLPAAAGAAAEVEASPAERAGQGARTFEAVYGPTAARVLEGLGTLDPLLPRWTLEFAYGRVIARPGLSLLDRELCAVAMLAALGGLPEALLGHMRGAQRLGAAPADLRRLIEALPAATAPAARTAALATLARLDPAGA
jgi:4-carboxymuconolactone decarboxylase